MIWLLLLACTGTEAPPPPDGPLGQGPLNPFPNADLVVDGRLDLPADAFPETPTPFPVERLAWRDGFSPGQPSVVRLPGVDPSALPSWRAPTPGEGGVVMVDLDNGAFLPCMAELDAWPDQDEPALLVRPLVALPRGHRIAVAVTTDAAPRPAAFQQLLDADGASSDHHRALVDDLTGLGVAEIAVAWDFPVGDASAPLHGALSLVEVPATYTFDEIRDADDGDPLGDTTWRAMEGTFAVRDLLVDDRTLDLQPDGGVEAVGEAEAYLYVHVPTSVRDAAPGTAPVLVFGHGLFGHPRSYLASDDDTQQVLRLAHELGAIVVATTWRGLSSGDRLDALEVARDFGQFATIPDRLVQAQANVASLVRLVREGDLLADPLLSNDDGAPLGDPDRTLYYGISLGGIEGAVLLAQDTPIEAGVLHVPGGMWSTMLERSTHWPIFELALTDAVPDPAGRQLLYAASQLLWDPVDPVHYTEELSERTFLLQEALGDEQVPNLTTRVLARSMDVPVLAPPVQAPWGLEVATGPLPAGASALSQFDPQVGEPPDVNRPSEMSGAHTIPRTWPGTRQQAVTFLADGVVAHRCGDDPCSADNPGADD